MLHRLEQIQIIPISVNEAWKFFSNPANLSDMTPEKLKFRIISELPDKIYPGMIIEYKIKPMLNVSVTWVTEIIQVKELEYFIDIQQFGPYKFWHHQHIFREADNGTEMKDVVHYLLPFGPIGRLVNSFIIKKQLKTIFSYRKEYLEKKYGCV